jgi:hypothetical protein
LIVVYLLAIAFGAAPSAIAFGSSTEESHILNPVLENMKVRTKTVDTCSGRVEKYFVLCVV